jgi:SAM-dependent methyltransferase
VKAPPGYFEALARVERDHWWHRGMREMAEALLGDRLRHGALLDAGCGTGGFLAWAASLGAGPLAGVDPSPEAVERARAQVPGADVRVAELADLPFPDASFAVVTCNDVLQHVEESDVGLSLAELRRVLAGDGALLVRTNGGRQARRERSDWRLYDRATLVSELERAGFRCVRVSHVNVLGSVAAGLRGRGPAAPTETTHGIPAPPRRPHRALAGVLRLEGELVRLGVRLPFGHTLVALAEPVSTMRSPVSAER